MAETSNINPGATARQARDKAVRQAEETFKNDLRAAAKARDNTIKDATAAKAEAVKQAQTALEYPRTRLGEARDRIEASLRKRELEDVRRQQEKILIQAESTRVKSLKEADALGKRLVAEAVESRKRAILLANQDEKRMKLEGEQALKAQKEAERVKFIDERKSKLVAVQQAAEAKSREQKAAAAEKSARQASDKAKEKVPQPKAAAPAPLKAPEVSKTVTSPAPKLDVKPLIIKEEKPKAPEQPKQVEQVPAKGHTGIIKLIITAADGGQNHLADFENSLRQIPEIRLVMVGGTKEGTQMVINVDKTVALRDILNKIAVVEDVNDRQGDILVKLK